MANTKIQSDRIDSSNRSFISAGRTGTQSITSGSYQKIQLNTVITDRLGEYDNTTNYRFTCLEDGVYSVAVGISYNSLITGALYCSIRYNGANALVSIENGNAQYGGPSISGSIELVSGDYLELWAYKVSAGTVNVHSDPDLTFMTITRTS